VISDRLGIHFKIFPIVKLTKLKGPLYQFEFYQGRIKKKKNFFIMRLKRNQTISQEMNFYDEITNLSEGHIRKKRNWLKKPLLVIILFGHFS